MSAVDRNAFAAALAHVDHVETYIMRYRADMSTDPRNPPAK
jgi:hypothetical protein